MASDKNRTIEITIGHVDEHNTRIRYEPGCVKIPEQGIITYAFDHKRPVGSYRLKSFEEGVIKLDAKLDQEYEDMIELGYPFDFPYAFRPIKQHREGDIVVFDEIELHSVSIVKRKVFWVQGNEEE